MPTGRLGTPDSRLGNIVLGSPGGALRGATDSTSVTDSISYETSGASAFSLSLADSTSVADEIVSTPAAYSVSTRAFDPAVFDPAVFNTTTRRALFEAAPPVTDSIALETTGVRGFSRASVDGVPVGADEPNRLVGLIRGPTEVVAIVGDSVRDADSDVLATQSGAEALAAVTPPDAIVTQSGAEAIVQFPPPPMQVGKAGAQAMVRAETHIRATQVLVQVAGRPDDSWAPPPLVTAEDNLVVAEETFTRDETAGWGQSEFGPAWEVQRGLPATFSVAGGRGKLAWRGEASFIGDAIQARLPFTGAYPIDLTIDFVVSPSDGSTGQYGSREVYWEIFSHNNHAIWAFEINAFKDAALVWGLVAVVATRDDPYPDYVSGSGTPAEIVTQPAPSSSSTLKQRVRIDEIMPGQGTISVKLWLAEDPEPDDWWVSPWIDAGTTFDWFEWDGDDYVFYGPWSPVGLRVVTNNGTGTVTSPTSIEIDRVVFNAGLSSAVDSIEHVVAEGEYPGTLREFLSTTDAISYIRGIRRVPTETITTLDWIHRVPSAEEIEELGILPGYLLYDFFDRNLPENQLGLASSGWPYPLGGQTSGFGNLPLYYVSDALGVARGGIWRKVPQAPRIGIRFDYLVPIYGKGAYFTFDGENSRQRLDVTTVGSGDDLGRWIEIYLPSTYDVSGFQYLTFDLNGADEDLRGRWLRILAVFPERNGEIYGLKVWPAEDPEPEAWDQARVETGLSKWAQWPEISFHASLGSSTPIESERAALGIDNLQIFDPLFYMPGGTTEYLTTYDTIVATHFHFPDDFYADAQDSVATWVPDMIMHRVERPQVVQPIDNDTTLAQPANPGDTTVVVTNPTGTGGTAPVIIVIGGEQYAVIGVGGGGTLTLDRGVSRPYAAGTSVRIRPIPTSIVVGGVDITRFVDFKATRLTTFAGPGIGTGEIRIKDVDRTRTITPGAEIVITHRGIRVWGGYVLQVQRSYAFPYGRSGDPAPRFLTIQAADYNILMEKRVLFNKIDPLDYKPEAWPVGTADATALSYMIQNHLDLTGDGIGFDIAVTTSIAPFEPFIPAILDGTSWMQAMNVIVDRTRAVFYIDPDKVLRYVDDSTQQSRFGYDGVSDVPNNTSTIGFRDLELDADATKMINDALVWGYGQGSSEMAFHREEDGLSTGSIAVHGRWQHGEMRGDMYKQESVQRRAETWVHGSAYNRRGHKDDKHNVRCTVFVPYFRVGDVVSVDVTSFGFSDLIPVRAAEITFPTPFDIQMRLTISHEIDPPWNTFEWWRPPFPDWEWRREDPPIVCPIDYVPQYEPFGPGGVWLSVSPPAGQNGWLVYTSHYSIGAGPGGSWIWIAGGVNYIGRYYIESPAYTFMASPPTYGRRPILHRFTSVSSGYYAYFFASAGPWIVWEPEMLETRSWQRIAVEVPGWTGEVEVTLVLDWRFNGWNTWSKYWMGGIGHSYPTPLGASQLSFNDSHQDGDWPDPFHIEGIRDLPDLIDMTSDLINGKDEFNASNQGTTTASGSQVVKRIMQSGGSVQLGTTYTGTKPHEPTIGHNDWHPSGGDAILTGSWTVISVKKVKTTLLVRSLDDRDDGTYCVSIPGWGDVTMPLQKTSHPLGTVYRFPGAYAAGTTRVYVDGVLQQSGTDYFETDPSAGYITLANETSLPVTGTFWVTGPSVADLGGLSFILPSGGLVTGTFGPKTSGWPSFSWHGVYYPYFHNGTDFAVSAGSPVYASAAGTVHWETQSTGGAMIHIYHAANIRTVYAHLSARVAPAGTVVNQGDLIAYSGDSGYVTGAHLHWGIVVNGHPEDPMGVL